MARIQPVGSSGAVTGSENFSVLNELRVLGRILNPSGSLVLSSSVGSTVAISGGLLIYGESDSSVGIKFGGTSAEFPFLKRNGSGFDVRNGIDSAYGSLTLNTVSVENTGFYRMLSRYILAGGVSDGQLDLFDTNQIRSMRFDAITQTIAGRNAHLILSSSAGSQVTVSGTLDVLGSILQNGLPLSTGGEVTGSFNFFTQNALDVSGSIRNPVGHLILSASFGTPSSVIAISGTLKVLEHLSGVNSSITMDTSIGNAWKFRRNDFNTFQVESYGTGMTSTYWAAHGGGSISSPSSTATAALVGQFAFAARDSSGFATAANVRGTTTQAWTVGNHGMKLDFQTVASGSSANTTRWTIEDIGNLVSAADMKIVGGSSHLILSCSAGSTVFVSGNLVVNGTNISGALGDIATALSGIIG